MRRCEPCTAEAPDHESNLNRERCHVAHRNLFQGARVIGGAHDEGDRPDKDPTRFGPPGI